MADQDPPPEAVTDPWSVFGDDEQSPEEQYKRLHRKLVFFFESRRCDDPSELAHETLARLMQKYGEHVKIVDLMSYSYGIAQNVLYEYLREKKAEKRYVTEQEYRSRAGADDKESDARKEQRHRCLEECASSLSPQERALLTDYFSGRGRSIQERRRVMAAQLTISREALTLRIFHLKRKLRKCINKCLKEK